ncbi:MAG: gliding motility protein GldL [Bacteroidales bacterium]|nr:gliding motility protein GldL [Bacteroidales bacterium]
MSKVYGIGAAVVIIGALFKINHYNYANEMLIIGLGTEALIFLFSAFEPPHVEPDWSLVYPQLAGMYGDNPIEQELSSKKTATQQLDQMFKEANIEKETLERLGQGLKKLSENAVQMGQLSNAVVATNEYVDSMRSATKSASELSGSYKKASEVLSKDATASVDYLTNMKSASDNAAKLSAAYDQAAGILQNEARSTEEFANTVKMASTSAKQLADAYNKSASMIKTSVEALDFGSVESEAYNKQLQQITKNMSAINSMYELQLQGTGKAAETADKLYKTMTEYLEKMNQTAVNTGQLNQQLSELNTKISAMNKVYGNMLTAMNVKP